MRGYLDLSEYWISITLMSVKHIIRSNGLTIILGPINLAIAPSTTSSNNMVRNLFIPSSICQRTS
jgi:hypothetical protein